MGPGKRASKARQGGKRASKARQGRQESVKRQDRVSRVPASRSVALAGFAAKVSEKRGGEAARGGETSSVCFMYITE